MIWSASAAWVEDLEVGEKDVMGLVIKRLQLDIMNNGVKFRSLQL